MAQFGGSGWEVRIVILLLAAGDRIAGGRWSGVMLLQP
jgi:hypothetical protein